VDYSIIRIAPSEKYRIEEFLRHAGNSLRQFRYFNSRPLDVIKNHIVTLIALHENKAVGYAHLDKENDKTWLGIAVAQDHKGRGLGKMLMNKLFEEARKNFPPSLEKKITLSVDNDNTSAIALYKKYGFHLIKMEHPTWRKEDKISYYEAKIYPIAISTPAFSGKSPEEIIAIAQQENYIIEFSSGLPYRKDMEEIFLTAPIKKLLHNYFPAPEKPFVINLASDDVQICNRSVNHCINGLRLASLSGAPFFSAHAGFCIDPAPSELGKKLSQNSHIDKKKHWPMFIDSVHQILKEAEKYNVHFLIENNVLTSTNLHSDGTNPLLCCDADELFLLMKECQHPYLGILLDTGHLKVSSTTLKFSLDYAIKKISPFVRAIHHSDNDGIFDTNNSIDENYWFWKYLKQFQNVYHILEVKNITVEQINKQMDLLLNKLHNESSQVSEKKQ
jgi:sugar phosphate isomerase/epimerase/GNAT superfamily N-acetyltransferase